MPVFDAARVSQIKQAIADGNFQINAGAIADRLISSAKELVDSQRRG
jgi:negative regulator of flagellin synthesis FlgM